MAKSSRRGVNKWVDRRNDGESLILTHVGTPYLSFDAVSALEAVRNLHVKSNGHNFEHVLVVRTGIPSKQT